MSGQGREEKGLFPKGMILACVILFLLGIGCVGMNLAAGPSEEKNPGADQRYFPGGFNLSNT